MNILTKIRLLNELNDKELRLGIASTKASWHHQYRDSAWVYIGGLPYELTEGDVICVMSQYGEIVNINLIRDKKTGKSKGFAFLCYQDQRSSVLAVDNLNSAKIKGRQIKVDHVLAYKVPKQDDDIDDITKMIREEGVAPKSYHRDAMEDVMEIKEEVDVIELSSDDERKKKKKRKKDEKKKKIKDKNSKIEKNKHSKKRSQINDSEDEAYKKKSRPGRDKNPAGIQRTNRRSHSQSKENEELIRRKKSPTPEQQYKNSHSKSNSKYPEHKKHSYSRDEGFDQLKQKSHERSEEKYRSRSPKRDERHRKSHKHRHRSRS